jgi:hypothetical protein
MTRPTEEEFENYKHWAVERIKSLESAIDVYRQREENRLAEVHAMTEEVHRLESRLSMLDPENKVDALSRENAELKDMLTFEQTERQHLKDQNAELKAALEAAKLYNQQHDGALAEECQLRVKAEQEVAGLKAAWTKVRTRIICTVDPVCAEHGFKEAMDAVKEMDALAALSPAPSEKPCACLCGGWISSDGSWECRDKTCSAHFDMTGLERCVYLERHKNKPPCRYADDALKKAQEGV